VDEDRHVAELYRRHVSAAAALGAALTGDRAAGEDVAQDAFLRCVSRLGLLRNQDRFRSYLLRTVTRTVIDDHRRADAERRAWSRRTTATAAPAERDPITDELLDALRKLPLRQRTAVAARFLLDWSELQTAQAMRCRPGTVKSLTSRGLAALRAAMGTTETTDDRI